MLPAGSIVGALYLRNYSPKHVELIEIINKLLLLHLVRCLHYCINDAPSDKYQMKSVLSENVGLQNIGLQKYRSTKI